MAILMKLLVCRLMLFIGVKHRDSSSWRNSFLGRLLHALFMRIYGAYAYFSGNAETEFSKRLRFSWSPPIRRKSDTALPTQCAVSHFNALIGEQAHFRKSAIGVCFDYARPRLSRWRSLPVLPGQGSRVVSFDYRKRTSFPRGR